MKYLTFEAFVNVNANYWSDKKLSGITNKQQIGRCLIVCLIIQVQIFSYPW